jgi:hypothetical protein
VAGLTLSEATVKTAWARVFGKLALRDRAQAVVLAHETGPLSPGVPAGEDAGTLKGGGRDGTAGSNRGAGGSAGQTTWWSQRTGAPSPA